MLPEKRMLLGVVLCGGRSRRMGRSKADLPLPDGRTFLGLARERLSVVCDAVCISTSPLVSLPDVDDCPVLLDPPLSCGPIGGITVALQYALDQGFSGCLFTPVDTPSLRTIDLQCLIDRFRQLPTRSADRIICAITENNEERLEPLIAIYPVTALSLLADALAQKQFGLQRLLRSNDALPVKLPADACRNVNTPSDLDLFEDET